jgi:uncharacterized membrane protein YbhN (UPF0104 family)
VDSNLEDETTGRRSGDPLGRAPRDGRSTVQAPATAGDTDSSGLVARASRLVRAGSEWAANPAVRPWLVGTTALAFVVLTVGSFRALPDEGRSAQPALVAVLVLVTTPATLVLNALEYQFMGQTLGHRIGFRHAMRVGLIASIANYLPAPGGVAVRSAALKRRGSTVRSAVSINAVAGLVWAGVTGVVAGAAMMSDDRLVGRASTAVALGAAALLASLVWLRRAGDGWQRRFGLILVIELGLVLLSGLRVWISLAAIGQSTGLGAAIAISGSTVLAAAVGIFPGGLGLRELLAGGIAAAVGVPAAAAVAATALERVASQVGMALTAVVAGVRLSDLRRGAAADPASEPGPVVPVADPRPGDAAASRTRGA